MSVQPDRSKLHVFHTTLTACFCVFHLFRLEKANAQVITRSRTGNLPPARTIIDPSDIPNKIISGKPTPEEIKEKMEQQLRLQRAAHQQKRALEGKNQTGHILKMVGTTPGRMRYFDIFRFIIFNACMSGSDQRLVIY